MYLEEHVSVQLRELRSRDARAEVQPVDVLCDDVLETPRLHQTQERHVPERRDGI